MQVNCALEILCYTCSIVDDIATIAPGKASQGHFKTPFKICEALENAKHSNLGFACGKKRLFHSQTNLCQQNSPSEEDFNGTRDGPYYHRQGRNQLELVQKRNGIKLKDLQMLQMNFTIIERLFKKLMIESKQNNFKLGNNLSEGMNMKSDILFIIC